MKPIPHNLVLKTEIKASFSRDQETLTQEESEHLDELNTVANMICERLQPAFQNLVLTMVGFFYKPK